MRLKMSGGRPSKGKSARGRRQTTMFFSTTTPSPRPTNEGRSSEWPRPACGLRSAVLLLREQGAGLLPCGWLRRLNDDVDGACPACGDANASDAHACDGVYGAPPPDRQGRGHV